MRTLSLGTAVFSLIVAGLTVVPGSTSSQLLDDEKIPDTRAGQLYRQIEESYRAVHGDSLLASPIGPRSAAALQDYLDRAKHHIEVLRNFERSPSSADQKADIDFDGVDDGCGEELVAQIRKGFRDRWGRLTRRGRKEELPPCSANSRRAAFVQELERTVENAAYMANAYRNDAHVFRVELRLAAALGLFAAVAGLLGWPTPFFLFALSASLFPFGYRSLAAGGTWISYLVVPLYAFAAVGSLFVDTSSG